MLTEWFGRALETLGQWVGDSPGRMWLVTLLVIVTYYGALYFTLNWYFKKTLWL